MKVYLITMMNGFVLMTLGLLGYLGSETPSLTALIPVFAGALLLSLMKGVKKGSKSLAHISVIVTLLVMIGLIKPFADAIAHADNGAVGLLGMMIISCAIALGYFVRSFVKVRTERVKNKR